VVGYALFEEPPPDFHAVFEASLGGRWVMFDETRLSPVDDLVRIAMGRDAKDVAFATIFGPAAMTSMRPATSPSRKRRFRRRMLIRRRAALKEGLTAVTSAPAFRSARAF